MTLDLGRDVPCFHFNIYVREFGKEIRKCVPRVKYAVIGKDGVI